MKILNKRLICFLDVLGFGNQLLNRDIRILHEEYSSFLDEAKNRTFYGAAGDTKRTNFEYSQIMSDSIVLVSNAIEDDIYNVNNFVGAVHFILESGFKSSFPLRGAITLGDFLVDEGRDIFLSRELAVLTRIEKRLELPICAITNKAKNVIMAAAFGEKSIEEGVDIRGNLPIIKYEVPLKGPRNRSLWCVNFTFFLSESELQDGINYLTGRKKDHFIDYCSYTKWLPYQIQILGEEHFPAKGMKVIATRSGMRMGFVDSNGNPCQSGADKISWTAIGRWKD